MSKLLRTMMVALVGLVWMTSAQAEILYKAKFGEQTWWILGTIHVGTGDDMRLADSTIEAFLQSDKVWMELTPGEMEQAAVVMMQHGMRSSDFFPSNLEKETWAALQTQLMAAGIQPAQIVALEPWLLELMMIMQIAAQQGFDAEMGSEAQLMARIGDMQGELIGFETAEEQILALIASAAESDQAQVERLLEQLEIGVDQLHDMKDHWVNGDLDALMAIMMEDLEPEQREAMLDQRNLNWMAQLNDYFGTTNGTYFIAVGAGHLGGETGLIPGFEAAGATIENHSSQR